MKPLIVVAAAALVMSTVNIKAASAQSATSQAKPDLIVLIAIDQFGSLLFDKWRGSYKSGFKRGVDEGIVYSNAYQSHGLTETCAGHSTMLTGKHPAKTGMVSNEWYDTTTGKAVYCVADAEHCNRQGRSQAPGKCPSPRNYEKRLMAHNNSLSGSLL